LFFNYLTTFLTTQIVASNGRMFSTNESVWKEDAVACFKIVVSKD